MDLVEPVGNGVVDSGVTRCHGEDADGVYHMGEGHSEDFGVRGVGLIVSEDDVVGAAPVRSARRFVGREVTVGVQKTRGDGRGVQRAGRALDALRACELCGEHPGGRDVS